MLTLEKLEEIKPHTIFATGTAIDNELGLFMANTGKELRWVAVRGGIADWAIYCHFADRDVEWIQRHGDKVHMESHIKMCMPCDEESFKRYRH